MSVKIHREYSIIDEQTGKQAKAGDKLKRLSYWDYGKECVISDLKIDEITHMTVHLNLNNGQLILPIRDIISFVIDEDVDMENIHKDTSKIK